MSNTPKVIDFHLIQNFAPSNLNRDDTGAPKDAMFGGHRRARVSSQCFKRSVRLMFGEQHLLPAEQLGIRTKRLHALLLEKFSDRDPVLASTKVAAAIEAAGLQLEDNKTKYLVFLGAAEIAAFASLIEAHWDALTVSDAEGGKKSKKDAKPSLPKEVVAQAKQILNGGKAVDLALFGRMLADKPESNVDAACQVAHAISTHRVERDFDYFTAIDDLSPAEESGAGMIGQVEFNSATLYRYASLSVPKLSQNLDMDQQLVAASIKAFVESFVKAIPTGKQNTFAAHNLPQFVGVCIRNDGPMSLANAFEKPVNPKHEESLSDQSIKRLADFDDKISSVYASGNDQWFVLDLSGLWPSHKGQFVKSLSALSDAVSKAI